MRHRIGCVEIRTRRAIAACSSSIQQQGHHIGTGRKILEMALAAYHIYTAHALLCLQYVSTLSFSPESVAHLALSLLQVLDYISVSSVPDYGPDSNLPLDVDFLDHIAKVAHASDHYLEVSIQTWRGLRLLPCHCRKHATEYEDRCERCKIIVVKARILAGETCHHFRAQPLQGPEQRH